MGFSNSSCLFVLVLNKCRNSKTLLNTPLLTVLINTCQRKKDEVCLKVVVKRSFTDGRSHTHILWHVAIILQLLDLWMVYPRYKQFKVVIH